jgi:hypothetical protein
MARVTGERWNLVAAILCTISASFVTIAALLSELNPIGALTLTAGILGTLGGAAWIKAALDGLRRQ